MRDRPNKSDNVFASRNFRLVFLGALVSELGAVLYSFAVGFYLLEISDNNAVLQGGYLAAPRWGRGFRRGRITGRITGTLSPEEIRAMLTKNSEINFAAVRLSVSGETNRVDNVLLMPMSAKENSGQETYTNILDVNNQVHHRPIRVAFTNRDFAWILSGLSEGDVVILN